MGAKNVNCCVEVLPKTTAGDKEVKLSKVEAWKGVNQIKAANVLSHGVLSWECQLQRQEGSD